MSSVSDQINTIGFIGFLTIIEHPRHGFIGGYLVLNPAGRPIEFHCTTPVRANRAQEILYGSSLYPYLYGEQIAQTLVSKSKTTVNFLLTDQLPVLALQDFISFPVIYVPPPCPAEVTTKKNTVDEILHHSLHDFGIASADNSEHEYEEATLHTREKLLKALHDIPGLSVARWKEAMIGQRSIAVPGENPEKFEAYCRSLTLLARTLDFHEPFQRIRLAVEEAQKAA